ncbi:putative G-protein beta WD 40 repeat-containing protein [Drechslerella dactyloides]|uniref:G-protein beta WD 40 repeat-containing protein n=1 Tax=Drechslerella dactyloides TaxID=74499 RepID=A0AAD6IUP9_DREDA|nr:putative G-protein beta WD 40 repeat-containing protein [Drechslerella dactyloides]
MSGVGEASLILGLISSIIAIIETTKKVYEAIEDDSGLPKNFKKSAAKLPLISRLLDDAEKYIEGSNDESLKDAFKPTLESCKTQAVQLQTLFEKVMPTEDESRFERYVKAARTIGKGGRVEDLVGGILSDIQLLATRFPTTQRVKQQLTDAIQEVEAMEPSLPDGFEENPTFAHYGSGAQNNNTGSGTQYNNNSTGNQNNGPGHQYIGHNLHIVNMQQAAATTLSDILHSLQCPDAQDVKNRLKGKDALVPSFKWILEEPEYIRWHDEADVDILWIRGGGGKGKTMMSIGFIETLLPRRDDSIALTYFFCQIGNNELNTVEAIVKGLILQLAQQSSLQLEEYLKSRLNISNDNTTQIFASPSWTKLWSIFLGMIERCPSRIRTVYVIVDAIDECQNEDKAEFLKHVVRAGNPCPSKTFVKWLLTSRPLEAAELELLTDRSKQVLISLDDNPKHVRNGIETYISVKVDELHRRRRYDNEIRQKIQTELTKKAGDSFLWVSLVCKRLELVDRDKASATIEDLPLGLNPFYDRVFKELSEGEKDFVEGCMRLLTVMILAYRPLSIEEVGSVTGLSEKFVTFRELVDRCASIVVLRENKIEFVHKSARDYFTEYRRGTYAHYGHDEIARNCLRDLSQRLKVNLGDLPLPTSSPESKTRNKLVASMEYAATFWVHHLEDGSYNKTVQEEVQAFLHVNLLMLWDITTDNIQVRMFAGNSKYDIPISFSSDGKQIKSGPLNEINGFWNSEADGPHITTVFSYSNAVRAMAGDSHTTTVVSYSNSIRAMAFSPNGKQIATTHESKRGIIRLQDTLTGEVQKEFTGHSYARTIAVIAFSPDGKYMASGSDDNTIRVWDIVTTGDPHLMTLAGHSKGVRAIAFSPDGRHIASGSQDTTIRLWDAITGEFQMGFSGHLGTILTIAFSPDGKQVASGSSDKAVKLWDITIDSTHAIPTSSASRSQEITSVEFSPDGKQIVSLSAGPKIKLWDATTGNFQQKLSGDIDGLPLAIVFSPDSKQIATGSMDRTIMLWDTTTGNLQKTITSAHSSAVTALAFSPDGKQIVSTSLDAKIKIWDTKLNLQKTFTGHSHEVRAIAFSLDGQQIASGSEYGTVKISDITTGSQRAFKGPSGRIVAVAFSLDGKHLAWESNDKIKLCDIASTPKVSRIRWPLWQEKPQIRTLQRGKSLRSCIDARQLVTDLAQSENENAMVAQRSTSRLQDLNTSNPGLMLSEVTR